MMPDRERFEENPFKEHIHPHRSHKMDAEHILSDDNFFSSLFSSLSTSSSNSSESASDSSQAASNSSESASNSSDSSSSFCDFLSSDCFFDIDL